MLEKRVASKYYGGDNRIFVYAPETKILLAYESVNWAHEDMPIFTFLQTLFGSESGFTVEGPLKRMHNRENSKFKESIILYLNVKLLVLALQIQDYSD